MEGFLKNRFRPRLPPSFIIAMQKKLGKEGDGEGFYDDRRHIGEQRQEAGACLENNHPGFSAGPLEKQLRGGPWREDESAAQASGWAQDRRKADELLWKIHDSKALEAWERGEEYSGEDSSANGRIRGRQLKRNCLASSEAETSQRRLGNAAAETGDVSRERGSDFREPTSSRNGVLRHDVQNVQGRLHFFSSSVPAIAQDYAAQLEAWEGGEEGRGSSSSSSRWKTRGGWHAVNAVAKAVVTASEWRRCCTTEFLAGAFRLCKGRGTKKQKKKLLLRVVQDGLGLVSRLPQLFGRWSWGCARCNGMITAPIVTTAAKMIFVMRLMTLSVLLLNTGEDQQRIARGGERRAVGESHAEEEEEELAWRRRLMRSRRRLWKRWAGWEVGGDEDRWALAEGPREEREGDVIHQRGEAGEGDEEEDGGDYDESDDVDDDTRVPSRWIIRSRGVGDSSRAYYYDWDVDEDFWGALWAETSPPPPSFSPQESYGMSDFLPGMHGNLPLAALQVLSSLLETRFSQHSTILPRPLTISWKKGGGSNVFGGGWWRQSRHQRYSLLGAHSNSWMSGQAYGGGTGVFQSGDASSIRPIGDVGDGGGGAAEWLAIATSVPAGSAVVDLNGPSSSSLLFPMTCSTAPAKALAELLETPP